MGTSASVVQSFGLFPQLPTELRLQIWQDSLSARVVELSYLPSEDRCQTSVSAGGPAALRVCRESRYQALIRGYKQLFGTDTHEPRIYFCPEIDTLYLPRPQGPLGYDDWARSIPNKVHGIDEVVHLALDHVDPTIRKPWETYNKYILMRSSPKVKEIFLVLTAEPEGRHLVSLVESTTEILQGGGASDEIHEQESPAEESVELVNPHCDAETLSELLARVERSLEFEVGVKYHDEIDLGKPPKRQVPPPPPLVLKSKVTIDQDHRGFVGNPLRLLSA